MQSPYKGKIKLKPIQGVHHWMQHMNHLASGFIYQKDCRVCTLGTTTTGVAAIIDNIRFYENAKKSGVRSIAL